MHEIFYFYSKGIDFINIISLMNSLAFPGTVEPDFTAFGVNEGLHNQMQKHIENINNLNKDKT